MVRGKAKPKRVLVTGGAGFIGSRLVRRLRVTGCEKITIYDCLHPQVHGNGAVFEDFGPDVACIQKRVEDFEALADAMVAIDPDLIVHLAAETGTGQSLDEIDRYVGANVTGTSNLLRAVDHLPRRQRDVLLSSSRAVYGEGPYVGPDGAAVRPEPRSPERMRAGDFAVYDAAGRMLTPSSVDGETPANPLSVYASTKLMQEFLLLNCAGAKALRPKILRFQNVYGPGQSLRNPYTGVLSIFAAQILAGIELNIFEDGKMVRDFIFVDDVVEACAQAISLDCPIAPALDVGSGEAVTILEAAGILLTHLDGSTDGYRISGDFRTGDIRHASADIAATRTALGWRPEVSLHDGLAHLADWARQMSRL